MAASMVIGLGALAGVGHATEASPPPRRRLAVDNFKQDREIEAWNKAVTERKYQKRQDKQIRAMQRRRG